ncbi:ABC transporter permease [Phytoactinopolyspora alkaliphila]|uniref:ABC transporter permease n=1 Tax=Phytoactinopolyspora alkaliphila TaxID=1783498 RepID=A0A6N9YN80_9ACTN|nr:ABC transporter permease [Phytoactinopolyspora alkaliphila]
MRDVDAAVIAAGGPPAPRRVGRGSRLRRLVGTPTQIVVWTILAVLVLAAVAAPLIAPFDPYTQDLRNTLQPPGSGHLLGTDNFGRDQFSRLLFALRSSLFIGVMTTLGVAAVGIPFGLVAGYARGAVDVVVSRMIDVGLALPALVLALGLIAALGAGIRSTIIALIAGYSAYLARIVRSVVLQIRQEEYVESARVTGVPPWRIAIRHVVPNVVGATLVQLTLVFAFAVVGEAGLSFVGLGVQLPTASLGNLLAEGSGYTLQSPMLAVAPGLTIVILLIALLTAGDGIREATDPRRNS